MGRNYRVGTRTSALALKQVEEIRAYLKIFYLAFEVEIVQIHTYGDRDKHTPISSIEGSDFFTREIDEALLKGEIDFAVHSAKDLPDNLWYGISKSIITTPTTENRRKLSPKAIFLREGLTIAAITSSIDPDDVLVSKSGLTLDKLPYRAKIGTSSLRRKTALKSFRQDFQIVDIRGNIEERLRLLDDNEQTNKQTNKQMRQGELDAIVIAAAGLVRLGLKEKITQRIPPEVLQPHPLQGALAVVARASDTDLIDLLSAIDHREKSLV